MFHQKHNILMLDNSNLHFTNPITTITHTQIIFKLLLAFSDTGYMYLCFKINKIYIILLYFKHKEGTLNSI